MACIAYLFVNNRLAVGSLFAFRFRFVVGLPVMGPIHRCGWIYQEAVSTLFLGLCMTFAADSYSSRHHITVAADLLSLRIEASIVSYVFSSAPRLFYFYRSRPRVLRTSVKASLLLPSTGATCAVALRPRDHQGYLLA